MKKTIKLDELVEELFKRKYGEPTTAYSKHLYFYFYVGFTTATRFWLHHERNRHLKDVGDIEKDLGTLELRREQHKDLINLHVEVG